MYDESLRPQKEVLLCEDGTNTLFSKEFNEPYHSTKDGALHESLEKHVKPSFLRKKESRTDYFRYLFWSGLQYVYYTSLYSKTETENQSTYTLS